MYFPDPIRENVTVYTDVPAIIPKRSGLFKREINAFRFLPPTQKFQLYFYKDGDTMRSRRDVMARRTKRIYS